MTFFFENSFDPRGAPEDPRRRGLEIEYVLNISYRQMSNLSRDELLELAREQTLEIMRLKIAAAEFDALGFDLSVIER